MNMRISIIIPILLLFPVPPVAGETLRGFHFLDNKIEDIFGPENGYATKALEIPVPDQMSFCLWSFADFNRFNDQIPIIEFYRLGESIPPFIALMYRDDGNSGRINSDGLATWPIRNFTSFERKWNHLCASVDIVENTIELFLNGKSDFRKSTRSRSFLDRLSNNTQFPMVVRLGNYYFDNKPLLGKLADVQIWNRTLSEEEIANFSACFPQKVTGNIVNDETVWNITGSLIKEIMINTSEVECSERNKRKTVLVTALYPNFIDAYEACNKYMMNSMADNFQSLDELNEYQLEATSNPAVLRECWTGGRLLHWMPYSADENKVQSHEDFLHVHTKEPLPISPWRPSQPNGKSPQCVKSYFSLEHDESWYDFVCENPDLSWAACTACKIPYTFESSVVITLRGLCLKTKIDTFYQVVNDADSGYISYIGKKATIIQYDHEEGLWKMRNINNPSLIGTSTSGLETFVMGTHNWTIRNDEDCEELKSTLLTLSTCKETEFTCRNGLCIDIEKRCNARTDCRDKSDEVGCLRINPDESYQKYIAPLPPSNQNSSKIIIEVSEDIVDILEIDEKASIFQVQFYLHFSWLDSRLTFFDLCNNPGLNNLSPQEKELLWIPVLVFENTENKVTTLVDNEATITIGKEGESYLSGLDEFNNREYYRGAENLIKLSRFYNTRFLCQYDLRWYPFDIQNCQLQFTMFGESGDFSTLESKLLNFFGERSSKEFVVENFFMRVSEDNGKTTLKVSNSLPPTSYMKMVDIYLIFCLFIPFVIVLLNTIMDYLRISPASGSAPISNQDDVTETERTINHHGSQITIPNEIPQVDDDAPKNTDFMFVRRRNPPTIGDILRKDKRIRPQELNDRNEKIELAARKTLYSHARKKGKILDMFQRFAVYGIPLIMIMFIAPYTIIGIHHVYTTKVAAEQRG